MSSFLEIQGKDIVSRAIGPSAAGLGHAGYYMCRSSHLVSFPWSSCWEFVCCSGFKENCKDAEVRPWGRPDQSAAPPRHLLHRGLGWGEANEPVTTGTVGQRTPPLTQLEPIWETLQLARHAVGRQLLSRVTKNNATPNRDVIHHHWPRNDFLSRSFSFVTSFSMFYGFFKARLG